MSSEAPSAALVYPFQGMRVEHIEDLWPHEEHGGYYCPVVIDGKRSFYCVTPNGHAGNLAAHDVTEHDDGTITVSPSILVSNPQEGRSYSTATSKAACSVSVLAEPVLTFAKNAYGGRQCLLVGGHEGPHKFSKRRVRIDLDGGYMDVSLSPDASPETVAALRELGQAAVNRMAEETS